MYCEKFLNFTNNTFLYITSQMFYEYQSWKFLKLQVKKSAFICRFILLKRMTAVQFRHKLLYISAKTIHSSERLIGDIWMESIQNYAIYFLLLAIYRLLLKIICLLFYTGKGGIILHNGWQYLRIIMHNEDDNFWLDHFYFPMLPQYHILIFLKCNQSQKLVCIF